MRARSGLSFACHLIFAARLSLVAFLVAFLFHQFINRGLIRLKRPLISSGNDSESDNVEPNRTFGAIFRTRNFPWLPLQTPNRQSCRRYYSFGLIGAFNRPPERRLTPIAHGFIPKAKGSRGQSPPFSAALFRIRGIRRSFFGGHRFACASEIAGAYVVPTPVQRQFIIEIAAFERTAGARMKSDGTFYRATRPFPGTFRHIEPSLLLSWPSLRVFAHSSPRAYMTEAKLETRDTRIDVGYLYLARIRIRAHADAPGIAMRPSLCRGNTNKRRRVSRALPEWKFMHVWKGDSKETPSRMNELYLAFSTVSDTQCKSSSHCFILTGKKFYILTLS